MARFLFIWELGDGWGHILPLVPVIRRLRTRGHSVDFVAQKPERADALLRELGVAVGQAPDLSGGVHHPFVPQSTFAHLLFNTAAGAAERFAELLSKWRRLFEAREPDVVVFEHSPTAMLAARGLNVRTARFGTGFCCPVRERPFQSRRPEYRASTDELLQQEERVLDAVNEGLAALGCAPLSRLDEALASDVTLLNTWPELDHGIGMTPLAARSQVPAERSDSVYLGPWNVEHGQRPSWPASKGKRVFLYSSYWPGLENILQMLERTRQPTVAYVRGIPEGRVLGSPTISVVSEALDVDVVARECELAIVHGGHGIVARLLRAGVPLLVAPTVLEQRILGTRVEALGGGLCVNAGRCVETVEAWIEINRSASFRRAAALFAQRYEGYDDESAIADCVQRLEALGDHSSNNYRSAGGV